MRTPRKSLTPVAMAVVVMLAVVFGAPDVEAQTQYIPYFGKNQIRYDNFDWHTYQTEHFEI